MSRVDTDLNRDGSPRKPNNSWKYLYEAIEKLNKKGSESCNCSDRIAALEKEISSIKSNLEELESLKLDSKEVRFKSSDSKGKK